MNLSSRSVGLTSGAAALALAAVFGAGSPAAAAANVPVAGLTLTPSTVAAGQQVTVAATAQNVGTTRIGQVAMGVITPLTGYYIKTPKNGQCRQTVVTSKRLVYCLVSGLPAGQTATLSFTVTPSAGPAGLLFSSYARNVNTGDETSALATLTVE